MQLIGILGEAGSGKDAAGKFLVQEHGYYSIALADPIKLFCMWMFGWSWERLWGPSELRNEVDGNLPFCRCPVCGYLPYPVPTKEVPEPCPVCRMYSVKSWQGFLSARFALQHLGTEWARTLNTSCHIDFAIERTKKAQLGVEFDPLWSVLPVEVRNERIATDYKPTGVYISDCRFKNEINATQAAGGKVYRIQRNTTEDNTTTGIAGHASEAEQREIADEELDGVISNDSTLDALSGHIRRLV